ncbi:TPA: XRE family transcriptional regulator, partial [Pseudomonas aeruginosa]
HELRKAQELSQETLAKALNINQAAVSKMERRTDMYISTLRNYIRAMGGELEIIATFPDGQVKIENFSDPEAVR